MSNKRIYSARELPAFTRWNPAALDEQPAGASSEPASPEPLLDYLTPSVPAAGERAPEPHPAMTEEAPYPTGALTAEQMERLHEEAWQEGHRAGLEAGLAQVREQDQALTEVLRQIQEQAQSLQEALAPQVLALALDFTRHLLRSELTLKPEHILPLVQELTQSLPLPAQHPKLHLHPDDVEWVRARLGDELEPLGWKILPDSGLQRGDCHIQTSHSSLDARLATRWQHLMSSLGQTMPLDDESA